MSNWKACNSPLHEPILNYFQDACYTTEKQNFANELLDVFSEYLK